MDFRKRPARDLDPIHLASDELSSREETASDGKDCIFFPIPEFLGEEQAVWPGREHNDRRPERAFRSPKYILTVFPPDGTHRGVEKHLDFFSGLEGVFEERLGEFLVVDRIALCAK